MARNLVVPLFPVPPDEYSRRYMAEVTRAFSVYTTQMQNPGAETVTTLTMSSSGGAGESVLIVWDNAAKELNVTHGATTTTIAMQSDPVVPTSYTVATLPSAATAGAIIYVTDETGGATHASADGTNWRRMSDRTIVA